MSAYIVDEELPSRKIIKKSWVFKNKMKCYVFQ
jgi:hypothetical protein